MEFRILENPDLKNAAEDFFGSASHGTQVLNIILLSFLLLAAGLMAIIQVPVYVESRGTLRPRSDKKQICSPVQGIASKIYVEENQKVRKNDLIMIIDAEKEKVQIGFLNQEIKKTTEWLHDCLYLTNNLPAVYDSLRTATYQAEFLLNEHEQQILEFEIKQLMTDIKRLKPMEQDSLISKKEMEEIELKYSNLIGKQKSNLRFKRNQWQAQLDNFRQKQTSLLREKYSLEHYIKEAEIRSPA
jgi:multidrug efflux pump subunit AcrA (membrane-fusion protein)